MVSQESGKWYWFHGRLPLYVAGFAAAVFTDRVTPHGIAEWLIEVVLVSIAAFLGGVREVLVVASLATLFSLVGLWTSPDEGVSLWLEALNRLASVAVIWLTVYLAHKRRQAEAEVKILRGLLPICAACKRIRFGGDQWQNLESYISQHSEATFTHSLCPECFERYMAQI